MQDVGTLAKLQTAHMSAADHYHASSWPTSSDESHIRPDELLPRDGLHARSGARPALGDDVASPRGDGAQVEACDAASHGGAPVGGAFRGALLRGAGSDVAPHGGTLDDGGAVGAPVGGGAKLSGLPGRQVEHETWARVDDASVAVSGRMRTD